ncbi:helix-turn-helix domain-containing protein [[Bacteroides] pectinophilus]|uniref:HTH cro/C1-type domain-containing protein n=1 Tax=[Bacteroides] pectinophilus ATCC 43243 TaxID=483218 RepID=B7AR52_9FIRM|nr:DNA-binding helix-turn-helix protein [[Bacteroides] pectinophilus ATCC 43243]UWN96621.1 helix-turn-helix domain-containing protein [[Bacteroides] pectinophilus]
MAKKEVDGVVVEAKSILTALRIIKTVCGDNIQCETFISRLEEMRKEKGFTQRELASKVGVNEVSMSRYIKGERVPTVTTIVSIAQVLGASVDYLVGTSNVKKRQNNADRIRNMSDEELAQFLCKVKSDYQWMEHEFPSEEEHSEWEEWLQSEAE